MRAENFRWILSPQDMLLLLVTISFLRLSKRPSKGEKERRRRNLIGVYRRAKRTCQSNSRTSIPTQMSPEPYLNPGRTTDFARFFANQEHTSDLHAYIRRNLGKLLCIRLKYSFYLLLAINKWYWQISDKRFSTSVKLTAYNFITVLRAK